MGPHKMLQVLWDAFVSNRKAQSPSSDLNMEEVYREFREEIDTFTTHFGYPVETNLSTVDLSGLDPILAAEMDKFR